jgi:hypothetical protein
MEEFQEQIPHVKPSPYTQLKARSDIIAKRQQRTHVYGEMERREKQERSNLQKANMENYSSMEAAYASIYEKREEDHELSMIRAQLHDIMKSCQTLMNHVQGGEKNMEAWIQAKITTCAEDLHSAANYIESGESNVK